MAPRWDLAAGSARLIAAAVACGSAQAAIYTCTDAKGRRITADRPIAECMDREQRELGPTGITRRIHGPSLTATEQAARDAAERKAREQQEQAEEERRQDRALLARYPDEAAHHAQRAKALAAVRNSEEETARANRRFDEELERLKVLWGQARTAAGK